VMILSKYWSLLLKSSNFPISLKLKPSVLHWRQCPQFYLGCHPDFIFDHYPTGWLHWHTQVACTSRTPSDRTLSAAFSLPLDSTHSSLSSFKSFFQMPPSFLSGMSSSITLL
jgi:hypothetical protein